MKDYERPGFDHIRDWDPHVKRLVTPESRWSCRAHDLDWPAIDVLRCSASRPWHLERSTPTLWEHFRYPGPIRMILVESVLEREFSEACIRYGMESGYYDDIIVIDPQRGQGYAADYPIRNAITAPFLVKWDDDFTATTTIPLDVCVRLMQGYARCNQVSFNKRRTVPRKPFWTDEWVEWEAVVSAGVNPNDVPAPTHTHGKPVTFVKKERILSVPFGALTRGSQFQFLTVKDRWWFGPAIWRMDFIRPLWMEYLRYWRQFPACVEAPHNQFNDRVLYKLIDPAWNGPWPVGVPAETVEEAIGCYLWGRIGDPKMAEHIGHGDSIWKGEYLDRLEREGRTILGERGIEKGKRRV